jgi:hypothetical protein
MEVLAAIKGLRVEKAQGSNGITKGPEECT